MSDARLFGQFLYPGSLDTWKLLNSLRSENLHMFYFRQQVNRLSGSRDLRLMFGGAATAVLVSFEVLHFALVFFGLLESGKCSQIAALAGLSAFLSRIQTKLSGFEFANHTRGDALSRWLVARALRSSEHLQQHQNYNDQKNQAQTSARVRSPTAAVRPCRNHSD
jgi:hypothetical protein